MEPESTPRLPLARLDLTIVELNAILASVSGSIQVVERAAGIDNEAWTLLNSIRTAVAEAIYSIMPVEERTAFPEPLPQTSYEAPWPFTQPREVLDDAWEALMEATVTRGDPLDGVYLKVALAGLEPQHISHILDVAITRTVTGHLERS